MAAAAWTIGQVGANAIVATPKASFSSYSRSVLPHLIVEEHLLLLEIYEQVQSQQP